MEKFVLLLLLQKLVVISLLVLFLHLDLGCCYGAQAMANRGKDGSVSRAIQTTSIRKLMQTRSKYGWRQVSNKGGWPNFRGPPPPAPRAYKTSIWDKKGVNQNASTPPLRSPKYRTYPPLLPPFLPRPVSPKKLSPPMPMSYPHPQHNPFQPGVPTPPLTDKPNSSRQRERKPVPGTKAPSVPLPMPVHMARPAAATVVSKAKHATSWPVYVSVVAAASFVLAVSAVFVFCCRASKVVTVRPWATGLSGQLQKAFVTGVPALKRSEVEIACEHFSNIIGSLSDYIMYKGTLSSGVEIAVVSATKKSAKDWSKQCELQFREKITSLSRVNHKNFVNLLGYCEEEQPFTRMMVFEYAPNGTLFEHLHVKEDEHLDWPTRLRVAMGIAYCLEHMHQLSPPEILRTLDSSTILLTDDFAAKVSDIFFCGEPKDFCSTGESANRMPVLSDKESTVFRYGIILLEIISGKFPLSEHGLLEHWAACCLKGERPLKEMVDTNLKSFHEETLEKLSRVIRSCTAQEPEDRPTMAEVASQLREATAVPPDAATPKPSPLWWAELEILSSEAD